MHMYLPKANQAPSALVTSMITLGISTGVPSSGTWTMKQNCKLDKFLDDVLLRGMTDTMVKIQASRILRNLWIMPREASWCLTGRKDKLCTWGGIAVARGDWLAEQQPGWKDLKVMVDHKANNMLLPWARMFSSGVQGA